MRVFFLSIVLLVFSLAYVYKVALRLPKGIPRLLAVLPIFPLFLYLPWLPPSCHIRTLLAIVFLWTCPSKLLLLCWNAGLDLHPWLASHFLHFLVAMLLPVRIRGLKPKQPHAQLGLHFTALWRFLGLVFILNFYSFRSSIPLPLIYFLYCVHFYLGLELALGAIAKLVSASFAVDLDPQFNSPLLSSSLSEFWGKRWNVMVNTILRATVYEPMLALLSGRGELKKLPSGLHRRNSTNAAEEVSNEGEERKPKVAAGVPPYQKPELWARALSMFASFLVSGLVHELIFVYVSKSEATGEMTAFFVVHGFATVSEVALRKVLPGKFRMPTSISRVFTLTFLYATASWFFMRPLSRSGTDLQAITEYHQLQSAVVSSFHKLL